MSHIPFTDSEGDDIIISSDEELVIALNEMNNDICKLFVELKTADECEVPFEEEGVNPEGSITVTNYSLLLLLFILLSYH